MIHDQEFSQIPCVQKGYLRGFVDHAPFVICLVVRNGVFVLDGLLADKDKPLVPLSGHDCGKRFGFRTEGIS